MPRRKKIDKEIESILKSCSVLSGKNPKLATLIVCILSLTKNDQQTTDDIFVLLNIYATQKAILKKDVEFRLKLLQN